MIEIRYATAEDGHLKWQGRSSKHTTTVTDSGEMIEEYAPWEDIAIRGFNLGGEADSQVLYNAELHIMLFRKEDGNGKPYYATGASD